MLPERQPVEVVALVGSAGGLDAFTAVLRAMEPELPVAILVQQHLGGQASVLPRILERRTGRTVVWARDGMALRSGRVLICPARSQVEVLPDRTLAVTELAPSGNRPHDVLLASLADACGPGAVAVVLTGGGSDCAVGVAAMKAAGAVVIAQSEDTAEYPSMPAAAAKAGADLVLPLHEIGRVVVDVVRGEALPRPDTELDAVRAVFGDEGTIAALAHGIDWGRTPLGPVVQWPPVLRSMMRLAMATPRPAGILIGDDHLFFTNEAGIETLGVEHMPKYFARSYAEAFPQNKEIIPPLLERVMAGEPLLLPAQRTQIHHAGRLRDAWHDVSFTGIFEADGTPVGVHYIYIERTQEVLSARRLTLLNALGRAPRGSSRRDALAAAFAVLADADDVPFAAAYLLDAPGRVARLVTAIGVAEGESLAPRELRRVPGATWPLDRVIETGGPVLVDDLATRFRGQLVGAGSVVPECAVVHPLCDDADGTVVGALVLGISPRTPLDDRYREFLTLAGDTISARVSEAHAGQRERQRLEHLAELDRAKTEFFSNVSHEFRTPLTLLLAPLQQALRRADELPADLVADLELAERNARRLLRLVGSLLDFSQLEAGRLHARFVPTDLGALTAEIASMFRSAAESAGLTLVIDMQPLPEPVWVDREMWEKVVSNLVSNALKFTWKGSVEVSLRALPKHTELVVRDTGVGIPADQLPHVFKRFHRVQGAGGRTHEGAGIGLALVDELIRRHHGRVRVTSEAGKGATFTVWLPLGRRPRLDDDAASAPRTGTVAAAMAEEARRWDAAAEDRRNHEPDEEIPAGLIGYAPGARVLVADDNADMRDYLVRLLVPAWHVLVARDGAEALGFARRDRPDLVLADVRMPGMDGFALLRELRNDPELSTTPVVLLTARAGEETAVEGLLAGADDYIIKPFSARELLARIGGQLELAQVRRRAAELNAFRMSLSDALRTLIDPLEIQQTACRMLVEQLGADRARFVEVDEAGGELITMGGYAVDGMPSGFGRYRLDDFAPLGRAILAGRRLAIDDTSNEPYVRVIRDALAELQIGAQLVVPLVRDGGSHVALAVHQRTARSWTTEEIAVAEEAAGRAWAEVERARAEAALRASEERFRVLADALPLGVGVGSAEGEILYTNRAYNAMLGYGEDDLVGRPSTTVYYDPADRTWPHGMQEKGVLRDHEVRFRHKDGSPVWVSINVASVESGGTRAMIGVVQDVSARKRAEAALHESEERMQKAVRATGMVTWEWVPSEDRITTSDGVAGVYGLPALARPDDRFALVLPEDAPQHLQKVRAVAADGGRYICEFRIRRPDGRIVWLEERAAAEVAADGAVERIFGVTIDITERKRTEETRRWGSRSEREAGPDGR